MIVTTFVEEPTPELARNLPTFAQTLGRLAQLAREMDALEKVVAQPGFALTAPEHVGWANECAHRCAEIQKTTDAERKLNVGPLNKLVDEVNASYMPRVKQAERLKKLLGQLIAAYTDAQEAARRAQFQLAAAAHQAGDHHASAVALVAASQATAATKVEGLGVKKKWSYRIVNASIVPRSHCIPDEKMLGAIARATAANATPEAITGVEWVLQNETTVR